MKYKTVVLFRFDEGGVYIDCCLTRPWSHSVDFFDAADAWRELGGSGDDANKIMDAKFEEQPMTKEEIELCRAMRGISLRARFNSGSRGPYVIDSDTIPTDEDLLAFYENTKRRRTKKARAAR